MVLFTPADHVREVYARYARRDGSGMAALLAPDVVFFHESELLWGGWYVGREEALRMARRVDGHIEAELTPSSYAFVGDEIAVTGKLQGRVRATGERFEVGFVQLWTVERGRVRRCVSRFDLATMPRALKTGRGGALQLRDATKRGNRRGGENRGIGEGDVTGRGG